MEHIAEEQLILHYYGEAEQPDALDEHLRACLECRGQYASLQRVLNTVDAAPVPERAPDYSARVWERLAPHMGFRRWWHWSRLGRTLVPATAISAMLVAAFLAGRYMPSSPSKAPVNVAVAGQMREQVLSAAVSDHLERSQIVLIELSNAPEHSAMYVVPERSMAENLVESNRLYRQTALATGNGNLATVLDDLERVLLDVAHSPDELTPDQLKEIRTRIEQQNLLFKLRILGTKLKAQEGAPLL